MEGNIGVTGGRGDGRE